jgi:tetratricopeptide (TPR) repeat protein
MLKFENIIKNLRLEEKVNLITNSCVLGNKTIPNYELPTFTVTTTNNSNATNTILPTYLQLAQTWNEELVDKCGEAVARNAIFAKSRTLIGVPTSKSSFGDDAFSSSEYLVGKIAAAYVRGIRNGGAIACLNKAPLSSNLSETEYRNNGLLSTEIAVKEGKVNAIISEGLDCLDLLRETYYKGLLICEASTSSDLISSIYEGNHLTLVQGFDAVKAVKDAIEAYERAKTIKSTYARPYIQLGFIYSKLGEKQAAVDNYLGAVRLFAQNRFYEEMEVFSETVLELDSTNIEAYKFLQYYYSNKNDHSSVINIGLKIDDLCIQQNNSKEGFANRVFMAMSLYVLKDYENTIDLLKSAGSDEETWNEYAYMICGYLSASYEKTGNKDKSKEYRELAKKIDPNGADAWIDRLLKN